MQAVPNYPHNVLNLDFRSPFFFCALLAYCCCSTAAPLRSLVRGCQREPAVLPLQSARRLFVAEEVYFKAGLRSG